MLKKKFLLALLGFLSVTTALGARVPSFGAQDMVALKRLSEVQVSPEGRGVLYTLRSTDISANRELTTVWYLDLAKRGAKPERLTGGPGGESGAQWSSEGSQIYFLSDRSGTSQIWRVAAAGAAAVQITDLPLSVGSFRMSPKGDRLLASVESFVDCASAACTADRLKAGKDHVASGLLFEKTFARHWDAWADGRHSQLYSIALDARGLAGQNAVNLTAGLDGDVPAKPFGGREDYAFSPDGATVAFSIRARAAGSSPTNFDIYLVPVEGGAARNITVANPTADTQPAFSPDGTRLAWLAAQRPGYESDRRRLSILDLKSGETRPLTQNWDRSIDEFAWSRDGKSLFAIAHHLGQRPLWSIDASSGRASAITGAGAVTSFSVGNGRIAFAGDDLANPGELYSVAVTGGAVTPLTRVNADQRAARRMGEFEQFSFRGAGGDLVYAYLVKPPGARAADKSPLTVIIHDGPHQSLANQWHRRWNAQSFAGAGYAALLIDFHGSSGYGQAFADSANQDWGSRPLEDIEKGIAEALKKYPWLDGKRMCALGDSFGGFLVNWIAGIWPDRFNCLVGHAAIFDTRALYYSTDEPWTAEWEFGGPEFSNPAGYAKYNPVDRVKEWKTPMLLTHGELDFRVPVTQGLSAFNALQRRGIPSELLLFPDEGHWIRKPANSMQWHEVVIEWMNRWTRTPAPISP